MNGEIWYDRYNNETDNILDDDQINDKRRKIVQYVQKYSSGQTLAEAVIISGKPKFLVSDKGIINTAEQLIFNDRIVRPLEEVSYLNKPYSFESDQYVQTIVDECRQENMADSYNQVKSHCVKYIDAVANHINLLSASIIYSYSQDKFGLTPYLFFVGRPGSGKSNNLIIINALGYRNYMSTDMTAPNIYQFLGNTQEGQGTLSIDEADSIDTDNRLLQIFKNGYTTGFSVAKTDISNGRKQEKYFTFGFKTFAAERLPDKITAGGFNDRLITVYCFDGNPKYDIAEVISDKDRGDSAQLENTKNKLLIYRLLHHHDSVPNYDINLYNREKQLFKPFIRLFYRSQNIWQDIEPAIVEFVRQRRDDNSNSLNHKLYMIVSELIRQEGLIVLPSSLIWNRLKETLPGENIPYRSMSYNSTEYGLLSQKRITEILVQVFGARKNPGHDSANKLIFDEEKLRRTGICSAVLRCKNRDNINRT